MLMERLPNWYTAL